MSLPAATPVDIDSDFARHVQIGLTAPQAFLSSRFIYDERGSKLFQDIMALEEYYLTRSEFEILSRYAGQIVEQFADPAGRVVELVELGAGDGTKSKLLLHALQEQRIPHRYRPVDISADILQELGEDLQATLPSLDFAPLVGSYSEVLATTAPDPTVRRVLLFLGSNIGNFAYDQALRFAAALTEPLLAGDLFLIGVDLRKNPRRILAAYDDAAGVTAAFNLNLLHRLQRELGAQLDIKGWGFYPSYSPETGEVRSYLYPHGQQSIKIEALGIDRSFGAHDVIHSEISRKYSTDEMQVLAKAAGAKVLHNYLDAAGDFCDALWRKD